MGRKEELKQETSRLLRQLGRLLIPLVWVAALGVPLGFWLLDHLAPEGALKLATPGALALALGGLLVLVTESYLDLKRSGRLAHSHGALLSGLKPGLWVRLRHLPMALRVLAICSLSLALARLRLESASRSIAEPSGT